jgi:hypothetical protein
MKELKGKGWKIFFDEARHRYYDEKNEPIISVTDITGVMDKPALAPWAANCACDYILQHREDDDLESLVSKARKEWRNVKDKAADIGSEIHSWVSSWIKGDKLDVPNDEMIANGITAFLKWQKEHKAKWLESEAMVYSKKYHYAGILDAVAVIDGKTYLVDFKSSKGIYPEMLLQVSGYEIAYNEMKGRRVIDGRIIIKLGKLDGSFEVRECEEAWDAFLSALTLRKWAKQQNI